MTWTRIGDDFNDRLDLLELSRSARLLWVEGLVYCNRIGTDGRIPRSQVVRFTDADPDLEIAELEQAGLWEPITGDDAWQVDWRDQETAEQVKDRQAYRQKVQKAYRDRKDRHRRGDHSTCDPRYCKAIKPVDIEDPPAVTGNETSNGTNNETGLVTTSRPVPVPARPKAAGKGRCRHRKPIASDGERCDECVEEASAVPPPTSKVAEVAS